jgi:hypothetical protein
MILTKVHDECQSLCLMMMTIGSNETCLGVKTDKLTLISEIKKIDFRGGLKLILVVTCEKQDMPYHN